MFIVAIFIRLDSGPIPEIINKKSDDIPDVIISRIKIKSKFPLEFYEMYLNVDDLYINVEIKIL